jgi:hypothetical protein
MKLTDYIKEFSEELDVQLREDEERWGDTWRKRPREGQVDRMMTRFKDYQDQYNNAGTDFPWLKVAGEALIGWVRDNIDDWEVKEG